MYSLLFISSPANAGLTPITFKELNKGEYLSRRSSVVSVQSAHRILSCVLSDCEYLIISPRGHSHNRRFLMQRDDKNLRLEMGRSRRLRGRRKGKGGTDQTLKEGLKVQCLVQLRDSEGDPG